MEKQQNVIGRTVIVYDRYHFALPLKGIIVNVAEKDGAYCVRLHPDQHGYPNYMEMSETYFFSQQCELQEPDCFENEKLRKKITDTVLILQKMIEKLQQSIT